MTTYGPEHLPYGVFSTADSPGHYRIGVRIGDRVLDAGAAARAHGVQWASDFNQPTLNDFLGRGPAIWASARGWLQENLGGASRTSQWEALLHPLDEVNLHLPITVADYVDFYASEHHATQPRADVSTRLQTLDAELEAAADRVPRSRHQAWATPVPLDAVEQHVFGVCLVNDWSTRDIQGPGSTCPSGRSSASRSPPPSLPWVVPLAALERSAAVAETSRDRVCPPSEFYRCFGGRGRRSAARRVPRRSSPGWFRSAG